MNLGLGNEALAGLGRMQRSLKRQETNQPPPIKTGYGTVSNPILTAEIEAVFDTPANVGTDFVGMIVDAVNGTNWLVWTDGLNWYSIIPGAEPEGFPDDAILSFPGLVSYWAGTVNRNTLVLKDMTSNGLDLTRNGNTTISRYNLATILNFGDSYWSFADDARLDLSGNEAIFSDSGTPADDIMRGITLLVWLRLDDDSTNRAIMAKWNAGANQRSYVMDYRDTNNVLRFGISSNGTAESFISSNNNAIVQDTWHFVAGRFTRATELATFCDGVKTSVATAVSSVFNSTAPFRIGEPGVSDDSGWAGSMAYPVVVAASLPDDIIEAYRLRTAWLFE